MNQATLAWAAFKNMLRAAARNPVWAISSILMSPFRAGRYLLQVGSFPDAGNAEALKAKTKYCRLVWRMEKGRRRWFVQLVQEGEPPQKYAFKACGQVVGLDIGPSTIAIVADSAVALERFAPGVVEPAAEKRRIQRAMDRSRRACNPDNYEPNGKVKKGSRKWVKSARYQMLSAQAAELERVMAATRK